MIVLTIVFTAVWQEFVDDELYNCTDAAGFGYWQPGNWVHHPIAERQIVSGRSMSKPDTIKEGWSIRVLWLLWAAFVVVSLAISVRLALLHWFPRSWIEPTV